MASNLEKASFFFHKRLRNNRVLELSGHALRVSGNPGLSLGAAPHLREAGPLNEPTSARCEQEAA